MTADVGLLYQHGKKPYKASSDVSDTEQQRRRLYAALARLVAAGFAVDTDGQRLKVTPARLLAAAQRGWIRDNKAVLVSALAAAHWRWCVEYPAGTRYIVDCLPAADWRQVSSEYPGAAIWPAPDGLDVADWIDGGTRS